MCSERVNRSLADPAAMVREDLRVAECIMSVAFDCSRCYRREFFEALDQELVDYDRAFVLLDGVIEARAFARESRETVQFLRGQLDRLTA